MIDRTDDWLDTEPTPLASHQAPLRLVNLNGGGTSILANFVRIETMMSGVSRIDVEVKGEQLDVEMGAVHEVRLRGHCLRATPVQRTAAWAGGGSIALVGPLGLLQRIGAAGVHAVNCDDMLALVERNLDEYQVEGKLPEGQRRRVYPHKGSMYDLLSRVVHDHAAGCFLRPDGRTLVVAQRPSALEVDQRLPVRRRQPQPTHDFATNLEVSWQLPAPKTYVVAEGSDASLPNLPYGGPQGGRGGLGCPTATGWLVPDASYYQCVPTEASTRRFGERSPKVDVSAAGVGYVRTPPHWVPACTVRFDTNTPVWSGEVISLTRLDGSELKVVALQTTVAAASSHEVRSAVLAVPVEGEHAASYPPAIAAPPPLSCDLARVIEPNGDEGGAILCALLFDPQQTPFAAQVLAPLASTQRALTVPHACGDTVLVAHGGGRPPVVLGAVHRATTPHPNGFRSSKALMRMPMGDGGGHVEFELGEDGFVVRTLRGDIELVVDDAGVGVTRGGVRRDVWRGCDAAESGPEANAAAAVRPL